MLKALRIENFVLIESLALAFEAGICLLTGETGAGKSILIDAMAAALGGRVSLDLVRAGAPKALIEATFAWRERPPADLIALLHEEGIEPAVKGELSLSREISARGSRCRIDGHHVTQAVLRRAGHALVDIASQHEHQALMDPAFHLDVLDRFGGHHAELAAVEGAHTRWHALVVERQALVDGARLRAQQQDFWRYQLQEIQQAALSAPDEDTALKAERLRLSHVEQLRHVTAQAYDTLYAGEHGPSLYDKLGSVTGSLANLGHLDAELSSVADQLAEAATLMRDAASQLRGHADGLDADPQRLAFIEDRLDTLNGLGRKYGPGLAKVIAHATELEAQLHEVETVDARLAELDRRAQVAESELRAVCDRLGVIRAVAAGALQAAVEAQLCELELPNARFYVSLTMRTGASFRASGCEGCEFAIAMNPGEPPKSLARTASGGEMARVMLALKTVLAGIGDIPTLVFDEVDTGISGKAAQAVAEKLAGLGRHYQILCVTHLPTVAAMADQHLHFEKRVEDGRTHVSATTLDRHARARELARLASGSPAPKALQHAEELLGRAKAFKRALGVPRRSVRQRNPVR